MNDNNLDKIAFTLSKPPKGILAADESTNTITKRFDSINFDSSFENRRKYRELLFKTQDLNKFISNIAKNSKVKAEYFVKNDQLFELTKKNRSKIIFLFLGAGTVTDWAQNFAKELKKIYE